MFKNRLFLYGLGLGLIAGAVMLQLMFKVDEMERLPTVEQLQADAGKLSYKVVPKEQPVYSDKEIEAIKQKAAEEERNKIAKQTAAPAPAPTNAPPAQAVVKTIKTVYISERMDASQVADMLANAGVLPDSAGLVASLNQKKLTTRIRAGSYSFEDQPSVDDVIAKITIQ
ncbi:endolytic transglycosylase MltG [Paenibacillus mesophilus]|uniref:endolytic transglycosylase MltG n=1 Tax=Paenibacillus mesophilus TaxID=2582849 RepID=UPI00110EA48A|nr:endolytic transglycosylase MltG [Paenibacillus mesophilus]TMV52061.1 endolytic transglycosylase MltG [Paenibacillus mesophilus]